jgi:putative copper resistance protein D
LAPETLHHIATVTLNAAAALAVGASLSATWLARGQSGWAAVGLKRMRRLAIGGLALALAAHAALLWLQAASMAEVPLAEAGDTVPTLLTSTHYGVAWWIGAASLVAALALRMLLARTANWLVLAALAVYLYSRSMVSHAASEGDMGLAMLADWLHLVFVSVWAGEVFAAVAGRLPGQPPEQDAALHERLGYVQSLSASATVALAGVFATGLFNAWRNLGSVAAVTGNPYGELLVAKIALVFAAAALGGINRFIVIPRLAGDSANAARFTMVLRVEAAVLMAVLVLAALLSSTSPPTAP